MMLDQSRKMIKRLIEIGYLNPNEIIIRPANSHFAETQRRREGWREMQCGKASY